MEAMACTVVRNAPASPAVGPNDTLPPEYWQALLADAQADGGSPDPAASGRLLPLGQIRQPLLRVGCRRCSRTVEIQTVDAIRLYGRGALWKDVGQRLLDNTCSERTGRHEEDGCWPSYD
ncbi:hypothetical protein [Bradyrhizobium diazoefficiens]|uniref:hypothetical protein n=1 Tax=Bradyrhizobium diazoefficiens TaxID=1355477 RepID=UPI001FCB28D7|nr:hypothetical protein [Bradyrhizobium diazoefficiens]